MITISLFALLTTALLLLVWIALLLRRQSLLEELNQVLSERANLQESTIIKISEDLMELQEELMSVTDSRNKAKEEILRTKENSYTYVQSLQEEIEDLAEDLDVANACIWDKEKQVSDKVELLNEVAAELYSLGFKDSISPNEVFKIREIALGQDIPF